MGRKFFKYANPRNPDDIYIVKKKHMTGVIKKLVNRPHLKIISRSQQKKDENG